MNQSLTPAVQAYAQQLLRKIEADCRSAAFKIQQSNKIDEVVRLSKVAVRGEFRVQANKLPEMRAMKVAAERRLSSILDERLKQLAQLPAGDSRKEWFGRFSRMEMNHLRGNFPQLAQRADFECRKLVSQADVAETENRVRPKP